MIHRNRKGISPASRFFWPDLQHLRYESASMRCATCLLSLALLIACQTDRVETGDVARPDAGSEIAAPAPADDDDCDRPAFPEGEHRVVVSLPYDENGGKANHWLAYALSATGELSPRGRVFEMGRATQGHVRFTSDGSIGVVAQENGSLGVFRFVDGDVEVVHAGYAGDFYAEDVAISPDDHSIFVVDANWRNHGGGIYRLELGCDGSLTGAGELIAASKSARGWRWRADSMTAVVSADDIADSAAEKDIHVVAFGELPVPEIVASFDAFPDEEAIITDLELIGGEQFAVVADTNGYSEVAGDRVAVVATTPGGGSVQTVGIEDPYDVLVSPYDNSVIVVSGFGDALYTSRFAAELAEPLEGFVELEYVHGAPALPGRGAVIEEGPLRGYAVIAENVAIRMVRFQSDGSVDDVAKVELGSSVENVIGAIGLTP